MSRARITVETWDPEYGSPLGDVETSDATVDLSVEIDPDDWIGGSASGRSSSPHSVPPHLHHELVRGARRHDAVHHRGLRTERDVLERRLVADRSA